MTCGAHLKGHLTADRRGPAAWLTDLWQAWRLARLRVEQRRALTELDDRLLRDLGITRSEALREARKPGWRH